MITTMLCVGQMGCQIIFTDAYLGITDTGMNTRPRFFSHILCELRRTAKDTEVSDIVFSSVSRESFLLVRHLCLKQRDPESYWTIPLVFFINSTVEEVAGMGAGSVWMKRQSQF